LASLAFTTFIFYFYKKTKNHPKMSNTHKQKLQQARKALDKWKELRGLDKELVIEGRFSAPTISKIKKDDENTPTEQIVELFIVHIDKLLLEKGYEYDHEAERYISINPDNDLIPENRFGKFKSIAGHYEMFFLASTKNNILKNVLILDAKGKVIIHGQGGYVHFGIAEHFSNSLIAINMQSIGDDKKPFFYQILFQIGNYIDLYGEKVQRIFAIATTITTQNIPSATLRVLFRINPNEHAQVCEYPFDSDEYDKLQETHPNLITYLTQPHANVVLDKRVNDML
jgi:hypothetical protein